MKPLLAVLVTVLELISSTGYAVAQHAGEESKSPKQVLEAYLRHGDSGRTVEQSRLDKRGSFFR